MLDFILGTNLNTAAFKDRIVETHHLNNGFRLHVVGDGSRKPQILRTENYTSAVFGTVFYKGESETRRSHEVLAADLFNSSVEEDELIGEFTLVVAGDEHVWVLTDWIGLYPCYSVAGTDIVSSSFVLAAGAEGRPKLVPQCLYEYVFQGAWYGAQTLIDNVVRLRPDVVHDIGSGKVKRRDVPMSVQPAANSSIQYHADRICHELDRSFEAIGAAFDGRVESAISGGFDSRLILAMLERHVQQFTLHVYGRSSDVDVLIAKEIAEALNRELVHLDKASPGLNTDRSLEQILENYIAMDGCPTDGIFDDGGDLWTRRRAMADGKLLLNGGGGEIFRNFFYLPRWTKSLGDVVASFYHQFDISACTNRFNYRDYCNHLSEKLTLETSVLLGSPRQRVESAYPLFRCRYWTSRNSAINHRLGNYMTPLVTHNTVRLALEVPLALKNDGKLEAAMISGLNPRLGLLRLDCGYAPANQAPLAVRLRNASNIWRPTSLRKRSFWLKSRFRQPVLPSWQNLYGACLSNGFTITSEYLDPAKITSLEQLNRLASAEFLLQRHI